MRRSSSDSFKIIAWAGHSATQIPQARHSSTSIFAYPPVSILGISQGHTRTQVRQETQRSRCTSAAFPFATSCSLVTYPFLTASRDRAPMISAKLTSCGQTKTQLRQLEQYQSASDDSRRSLRPMRTMWMILRGSNSGIAWLTGHIPEQAPHEKQLLRCSPPGSAITSALKRASVFVVFFAIMSPINRITRFLHTKCIQSLVMRSEEKRLTRAEEIREMTIKIVFNLPMEMYFLPHLKRYVNTANAVQEGCI